jgi:hypothetical protein
MRHRKYANPGGNNPGLQLAGRIGIRDGGHELSKADVELFHTVIGHVDGNRNSHSDSKGVVTEVYAFYGRCSMIAGDFGRGWRSGMPYDLQCCARTSR